MNGKNQQTRRESNTESEISARVIQEIQKMLSKIVNGSENESISQKSKDNRLFSDQHPRKSERLRICRFTELQSESSLDSAPMK
jgi:hypothetical protein